MKYIWCVFLLELKFISFPWNNCCLSVTNCCLRLPKNGNVLYKQLSESNTNRRESKNVPNNCWFNCSTDSIVLTVFPQLIMCNKKKTGVLPSHLGLWNYWEPAMFSHRASSLSALNHNHILPLAGSQHLPFAICEAVSVQIDNEEHGSRKRRQHNV